MNTIFYELLDNTMAEICRREPAYHSYFQFAASPRLISKYMQHPFCNRFPPRALEQALTEGLAYVGKGWIEPRVSSTEADPIVQFLFDCIVDAFSASEGLLSLQPYSGFRPSVGEVLARQYTERQTTGGVRYYIRNAGSRPLLLINATGTPIAVWSQFFADGEHDFKIIVPHRRGSDLFRGGLQKHVDITTDSADLASILEAESLGQSDVLAWCNGARVAIDLATRWPQRISSMVLIGPMLKGVQNIKPSPSNFERDLQPLLDAVSQDSSLAPFLSQTIAHQPISPDWSRWVNAPSNRAQVLFAMPAREHADAMIANLTDPESFINIARRVQSDESYPMARALRDLETRTLVVMGADDNIVSNQLSSSAMKQMCCNCISRVVLRGSGHYIHDLQYHYLRWLLSEFLEKHQPPRETARISVEQWGRCSNSTKRESECHN